MCSDTKGILVRPRIYSQCLLPRSVADSLLHVEIYLQISPVDNELENLQNYRFLS